MQVLGLIPARGGSKDIPRKNIRLLGGKPLIAYTIEAASLATSLDRTVVSTDDEEIAWIATSLGAEVPFRRPKDRSEDHTPMVDVLLHALQFMDAEGMSYDALCLLQPTSPLRAPGVIDRCIDLLVTGDADSVMTIAPIPANHHPYWAYMKTEEGTLRLVVGNGEPPAARQALPAAFYREGSVYVTRVSSLRATNSLYGNRIVGLEVQAGPNLDEESDWAEAERLIATSPS